MPAYYSRIVSDFLQASASEVIGEFTRGNARFGFPHLETEQTEAWDDEVATLRTQLSQVCAKTPLALTWGLLLEFSIPRRQHRIDAVLLTERVVFVLEFKSGSSGDNWAAARQVEDYALDLSYFHAPSRDCIIAPVVVAPGIEVTRSVATDNKVMSVARVTPDQLAQFLCKTYEGAAPPDNSRIMLDQWDDGAYEPVPTVIEAAMALYAGMSVKAITRSHSGAHNLTNTTDFVLRAITEAQRQNEKVVCFITGIPGAGKTLAGLNLVHNPEIHGHGRPASVFMSGNGPLVKVLREALALDCADRTLRTKAATRSEVRTFIQNIHQFVAENLDRSEDQLPYEHAIVFDEAQRAWSAEKNRQQYRKRLGAWHISEPDMVLKIMDRHKDWAAVIALVGGGQEIHDGEAGLAEWGRTLQAKYSHWRVMASPEALDGGESVAGGSLFRNKAYSNQVTREAALHLQTCLRSHQAEDLATWVNRVITGDAAGAAQLSQRFPKFPIRLSRSLEQT